MDIEDRAEKWARENGSDHYPYWVRRLLVEAYLAGSAQTQADYCKEFLRR